ncbi:type IX secretion system membrane protein PorP/SprF [Paracrocinitomix mangrovi]|uniref:PorP/SprF family type IX secretion system membrane protein n=1 Tax=Paracrocinitomix mangrovi TaxID=2862509 RepID=UPI001C8EB572|nr:type IX secretion system membrane protein PorP/SprF [Paracrocinitomix mangrovi]UKN02646.1 type IX secretion system membrane protein PorP/SprF [Paracrocinitomix mangrovi]
MKVILIACLTLLVVDNAKAQQEPMVSQYMFNGLFLNPAYAGSQECITTTMLFRKQWVGFDGSPYTFTAAADMPLVDNKMGVGLVVSNDNIGVTNQTDIVGNYSYNVKLSEEGKLAFGLKAGMSIYSAKVSELTTWDESDPMFGSDIRGQVIPKFGFGMYYHQKEKWYAGISIPTLLAYEKGMGFSFNINKTSFMRRHLLITGGYIFQAGENVKLKPSILMKYITGAPFEADINFSALFKETIWVGASFRTGDALVALLEYQASNSFRVGYAYDITFSNIRKYSAGSHEIMIGYDFGKGDTKEKTPRYF